MKIPVGKGGLVHMTHDIFIHKSSKKGKRRTSENKSFNFSTRISLSGRLFLREPVNFVRRKWTVSQESSQNISKY